MNFSIFNKAKKIITYSFTIVSVLFIAISVILTIYCIFSLPIAAIYLSNDYRVGTNKKYKIEKVIHFLIPPTAYTDSYEYCKVYLEGFKEPITTNNLSYVLKAEPTIFNRFKIDHFDSVMVLVDNKSNPVIIISSQPSKFSFVFDILGDDVVNVLFLVGLALYLLYYLLIRIISRILDIIRLIKSLYYRNLEPEESNLHLFYRIGKFCSSFTILLVLVFSILIWIPILRKFIEIIRSPDIFNLIFVYLAFWGIIILILLPILDWIIKLIYDFVSEKGRFKKLSIAIGSILSFFSIAYLIYDFIRIAFAKDYQLTFLPTQILNYIKDFIIK